MYKLTLDQVKILVCEYADSKLNLITLLVGGEISNILLMPFGSVIKFGKDGFYLMGYTQHDQDIEETLKAFDF